MRHSPIKIVLTYIVALLPGIAGLILLALPLYDVWVLVCAGVLALFSCGLLALMRYCFKLEADYTKQLQAHDEEAAQREKQLAQSVEEFNAIIAGMPDGLVVFAADGSIVSANPAAREILAGDTTGGYQSLSREKHYLSVVESALAGETKTKKMKRAGRVYSLSAAPATGTKGDTAAVLFIVDITDAELSKKMRREFSANVSHELKTPLTSILGYAEIIGNGLVKAEDIPKFAGRIRKEAARLLTLIEDIIKLSRLDEDELRAEFAPVELHGLCEAVLGELAAKAEKSQVTLSLTGKATVVSGFEPALYEMVHNLCDNAIAYNRPGGGVRVALETVDGRPQLSVADDGIGIAPEHLGRIFERFYRVDKSHSKDTGGTGLGLSIVKHDAQLHDAQLSVDSTPGVGTTIRVLFRAQAREKE